MTKVLSRAIDEASQLPPSDQDEIGRRMLDYVRKLKSLRDDVDAGLASLDRGEGRSVDLPTLKAEARRRDGR